MGPAERSPSTAAGSSAARSPTVRHAHPAQPLERGRADAPQALDRERVEVGQLLARPDLEHARPGLARRRASARGLASTDASLARNLFGRDADRARQPELARAIVGAEPAGDRHAVAEQGAGAGDVEERLVERQRLDERRHGGEDGVDLAAGRGVGGVVAGEEHRRRAQPAGRSPTACAECTPYRRAS